MITSEQSLETSLLTPSSSFLSYGVNQCLSNGASGFDSFVELDELGNQLMEELLRQPESEVNVQVDVSAKAPGTAGRCYKINTLTIL